MKKFPLFLLLTMFATFSFGQYNLGGTPGSALDLGGECFRLTPNAFNSSGVVWFQNKISIASDFTIEANIYLGNSDAGADGLAFVLQPVCNGAGSAGGGIGYQGISPSLAVEFDTWQNFDPPQDHVGLMANGNVNHIFPNPGANELQGFYALGYNLEDGATHPIKIEWKVLGPNSQNIIVTLDNVQVINHTSDLITNIFGGNHNVFWGFTAATGAARNEQSVCITSKSFTQEGSYTVTQPTCPDYNNGAIDLNPAGGIGPFSFLWNTGATSEDISNLTAGTYNVTVTDGNGCQSKYTIEVTNAPDVTPPTISSVTASPNVLWSPNHKMVTIAVGASSTDNCGGATTCNILSVTSNEPDNGLGDGDQPNDIELSGNTLKVRSERQGGGAGRIYTITVQCTDASGNSSTAQTTVSVPANQSGAREIPGNTTVNGQVLVTGPAIRITPNPSKGIINLQLNGYASSSANIVITDINGVEVQRKSIKLNGSSQTMTLNLGHLSKGMYMIRVVSEDGVQTVKAVIQK